MVKSTHCAIDIDFALALRNVDIALARHFRCVECGDPVEPHEAGIGKDNVLHPAHFEHVTRNQLCSRSAKYKSDSAVAQER